jgi:hypothetical protein
MGRDHRRTLSFHVTTITCHGRRRQYFAHLAFNHAFGSYGWSEKSWDTKIVVDDRESASPTHKVDHYKNHIAVEVEWSNKDPCYDRDLNNFRLLFDLRVISVGVIITKSDELKEVFTELNNYRKYGASTTWMGKLKPRIDGGGGGGCPILVFGIKKSLYDPNS